MRSRMLKASCSACGYTIRAARKWLRIALPSCPNPECARCGERLDAGEGVERVEAELEQWMQDAEAWEADALSAAYTPLKDREVRIRVPHRCNACHVEEQVGERMRLRVYTVGGDFHSEYTCLACELDAGRSRAQSGTGRFLAA